MARQLCPNSWSEETGQVRWAKRAYFWFVVLHIPLFALLMWWTGNSSPRTRFRAQLAVDAFLAIHLALHVALRSHPDNTFQLLLSELCIYGAGVAGILHGALLLRAGHLGEDAF